ncbi:MAG: tyrosine-type recombinase/integrase, partial [Microcystaceae cyanobacterium]
AIQCGYDIEAYCQEQISKNEAVDLEQIKRLVEAYKNPHLKVVSSTELPFLWDKYVSFHKALGCWSECYLLTHIQTVGNLINRSDFPIDIEKPSEILQWLLEGKRSVSTAKDRFKMIVTAIDWASKNDHIDRRYGQKYRDCLSTLNTKLEKQNDKQDGDNEGDLEDDIDPFTKEEIYRILAAFKTDSHSRFKGKHSQYYPFLEFLWLTGCRPSEAVALKWDNVNLQKGKIRFCEVEVIASGKRVKRKRTKTQKFRVFPINEELRALLESLPKDNSPYVFTRNDGTPINQHTLNGIWKRLLPKLEIRYRVPYQFRHSMISYHANRNFPLTQLAEIVGNSEKIIRDCYLKVDISLINVPTVH